MGFRPQYAAAWAFHHRRKCRPRQINLAVGENNDMNIEAKYAGLEVGYDVPALPGMSEDEIQTPCLILDLDALEHNIRKKDFGLRDLLTADRRSSHRGR